MNTRQAGMSLIELMVAIAVLAIIVKIAVPSFSSTIQAGRAQAAADGLRRIAAQARDIAMQTGQRTTLTYNGQALSACADGMWTIVQGADKLKACLTKTDFAKRYEGATLDSSCGTVSFVFSPSGLGGLVKVSTQSLQSKSCTVSAGGQSKTVKFSAGGIVDVL